MTVDQLVSQYDDLTATQKAEFLRKILSDETKRAPLRESKYWGGLGEVGGRKCNNCGAPI